MDQRVKAAVGVGGCGGGVKGRCGNLREQLFLLSFELSFSNYSLALQIGQLGYLIGTAVWRLDSGCTFLFTS